MVDPARFIIKIGMGLVDMGWIRGLGFVLDLDLGIILQRIRLVLSVQGPNL